MKQQNTTSTNLQAIIEEGPCIKLVEKSGQQVFYTGRKQLNKIRKEEIGNPQKQQKKDKTEFCILFFIYI